MFNFSCNYLKSPLSRPLTDDHNVLVVVLFRDAGFVDKRLCNAHVSKILFTLTYLILVKKNLKGRLINGSVCVFS